MGKAMRYMLKRWKKFTLFTQLLDTQSGQPLAALIGDKTVAYTYVHGKYQKFGILVWP